MAYFIKNYHFVMLIATSNLNHSTWFQYGFHLTFYLLFSSGFRFWQNIEFVVLKFAICQRYLSNIPNLDINSVNLYTIWKSIFQTTTLHVNPNRNIQSTWSYQQNSWHALLFSATVLCHFMWSRWFISNEIRPVWLNRPITTKYWYNY